MVMVNTTQELVDLDGNKIAESETQNLTLGRAMSNALMGAKQHAQIMAQLGSHGGPKLNWTESQAYDAYELALRLRNPKAEQPVQLQNAEVRLILDASLIVSNSVVFGQIKKAIDPPTKKGGDKDETSGKANGKGRKPEAAGVTG